MKITETQKPKSIPYTEIKPGMVFVVRDGCKMLKLENNEAVLLTWPCGIADRFDLASGYKGEPATKILGYVKEIIVKEI